MTTKSEFRLFNRPNKPSSHLKVQCCNKATPAITDKNFAIYLCHCNYVKRKLLCSNQFQPIMSAWFGKTVCLACRAAAGLDCKIYNIIQLRLSLHLLLRITELWLHALMLMWIVLCSMGWLKKKPTEIFNISPPICLYFWFVYRVWSWQTKINNFIWMGNENVGT